MALQQINIGKLKSTGTNLTNLASKMKSKVNKLDENIQKMSSVWGGEANASYLKRYQVDKANLAQLTQILQQMGAALGEFSDSHTKADNKAMDPVHRYLGKQEGEKMVDANVKVDPKQLKSYSNNIRTGYRNMYSYLSESKIAVKNLESTWTGSRSAELYSRFDTIIGKCEEVLNVVNTYALTLSEAADVYSANEQEIPSSAGKLKINLKWEDVYGFCKNIGRQPESAEKKV